MINKIKSVHPFPARMAPSILWKTIPSVKRSLTILDPMSGSGTTLAVAKIRGHHSIGYDTDPLAVLISNVWGSNINEKQILVKVTQVLDEAKLLYKRIKSKDAYPINADNETRAFARFWFDLKNRKQLKALSISINNIDNSKIKSVLWCALSRLIITKKAGVSLGMDISHSRPHKVYEKAPFSPFDKFLSSVKYVTKNAPFKNNKDNLARLKVKLGDARKLPIKDSCIDFVITSPPYLNAIDYMRGHKLSLIWLGYNISKLRSIRSRNIGSERNRLKNVVYHCASRIGVDKLSDRMKAVVFQYIYDMNMVLKESYRVLKRNGKAVFVVGNSTVKGAFVRNSEVINLLGRQNGFTTLSIRKRNLPPDKRYLPPPSSRTSGKDLAKRMRQEVVITFAK